MEKFKELLTATESSNFSAMEGSKRLGDFCKKYPTASKIFQQAHTNENMLGVDKKEINALMEALSPFADEIYPIIADMFNKAEELQEKLSKDKTFTQKMSLHVWLCNRIQAVSLLMSLAKSLDEAEKGNLDIPLILPEGFELPKAEKDAITNMVIIKVLYTNLQDANYYVLSRFIDDVVPESKIPPEKLN